MDIRVIAPADPHTYMVCVQDPGEEEPASFYLVQDQTEALALMATMLNEAKQLGRERNVWLGPIAWLGQHKP